MTELREKMLRYIRDFGAKNGYPPSVREIMRHFGFKSPRAVSFHLEKLEAEGYLECHGKARGLRLKRFLPGEAFELPIYGVVPAGFPEPQSQETLDHLAVRSGFISPSQTNNAYALRVKGNSMSNAKIFDGDIAVVESRTPKNNDIVVALLDGESALKRLVEQDHAVYLRSENPECPNLLPAKDLKIQGVVIGVYRPMP